MMELQPFPPPPGIFLGYHNYHTEPKEDSLIRTLDLVIKDLKHFTGQILKNNSSVFLAKISHLEIPRAPVNSIH